MLNQDFVFVFDKDGVITNTEIFKLTLLEKLLIQDYPEVSEEIIAFNRSNRGMYRSIKIQLIFEQIIKKRADKNLLSNYLDKFATEMKKSLLNINLIPGVLDFIKQEHTTQFISSAAPEEEVQDHLQYFGINSCFKKIYASPDYTDKYLALKEIQENHQKKVLFFGDSISDLKFAQKAGVCFIGITYCSDAFKDEKDIYLLHDFNNAIEIINNYLF